MWKWKQSKQLICNYTTWFCSNLAQMMFMVIMVTASSGADPLWKTIRKCENENCLSKSFLTLLVGFVQNWKKLYSWWLWLWLYQMIFASLATYPQNMTIRKYENENFLSNCFVPILVGFVQTLQRWYSCWLWLWLCLVSLYHQGGCLYPVSLNHQDLIHKRGLLENVKMKIVWVIAL